MHENERFSTRLKFELYPRLLGLGSENIGSIVKFDNRNSGLFPLLPPDARDYVDPLMRNVAFKKNNLQGRFTHFMISKNQPMKRTYD